MVMRTSWRHGSSTAVPQQAREKLLPQWPTQHARQAPGPLQNKRFGASAVSFSACTFLCLCQVCCSVSTAMIVERAIFGCSLLDGGYGHA